MAIGNRQFFQPLTGNGLSAGVSTLFVDGSVTPVTRKILPQYGTMAISRFWLYFQSAAGSVLAGTFCTIAALANGLIMGKRLTATDAVTLDLLDGDAIKTNAGFSRNGFDLTIRDFASGEDYISAEYAFESKCGGPLIVNANEYFAVTVRDNLSAMTGGRAIVSGLYMG